MRVMAWLGLRGGSARRERRAAARAADELYDVYMYACGRADEGDYAGASAAFRRALPESARIYGEGDAFTLVLMSNLASALVARGDFAAARDVRQRAFEISRDEPGYGVATVVYALTGLASVQLAQGDLVGARAGYQRALDWWREELDDRYPEVGAARNGLARTLAAQGEYAAAEDLYIEAVEHNERVLGTTHVDTVAAARNRDLARSLPHPGGGWTARMVVGDLAGARRLLPAANEAPPAAVLNALGEVRREQRDMMGAYRAYERATESGEGPDALAAFEGLAQVMLIDGDVTNAVTTLAEGLAMRRALLGDHHPDVAIAQAYLDWVRPPAGNIG